MGDELQIYAGEGWGRWDSGIDGDGDLNNEYVLLKPDTVHRVVLLTVLFSGGWTLMPVFTVSGFMSVIVIAAETSAQSAPTRHQTSQLSVFHTQSQIFVPMRESRAMLRFLKAQCYRENNDHCMCSILHGQRCIHSAARTAS